MLWNYINTWNLAAFEPFQGFNDIIFTSQGTCIVISYRCVYLDVWRCNDIWKTEFFDCSGKEDWIKLLIMFLPRRNVGRTVAISVALATLERDRNDWPKKYAFIIYSFKCFSLYDINNEIDVQFCINTFDHVMSFFFYMRMNTISSLQYIWVIVLLSHSTMYRLYGRKTHKTELIFIGTRYIVVAYIVIS